MINGWNSGWTDARSQQLSELWCSDLTPEAIANVMGGFAHTKDGGRKAVIGRANRMGLPPKRVKAVPPTAEELEALQLSRRQRQIERERARVRSRGKNGATPRAKPAAKPAMLKSEPFLGSLEIPFREWSPFRSSEPNECRFIAAESPGPDYAACGNKTKIGKSYCDHHHAKCHYAGGTSPLSEAEKARRSNHGKALGFAAVKRHRVPALFPVGEISPAQQLAEAGA